MACRHTRHQRTSLAMVSKTERAGILTREKEHGRYFQRTYFTVQFYATWALCGRYQNEKARVCLGWGQGRGRVGVKMLNVDEPMMQQGCWKVLETARISLLVCFATPTFSVSRDAHWLLASPSQVALDTTCKLSSRFNWRNFQHHISM